MILCHCGRPVKIFPNVLADGHTLWMHLDDGRIVCTNSQGVTQFAQPADKTVFQSSERLQAVEALQRLESKEDKQ
jgi:hypothetical protein